jgi:SH3-like domain-containing protein
MRFVCSFAAAILAGTMLVVTAGEIAAKDANPITSGLPVPRFVSLKSDHVNVRVGPTKDNDVSYI